MAFTFIAFVSGICSAFISWTEDFASCGRAPDQAAFLAECTQKNFGDFETAAFLFDLENDAVESLRKADVVLLGNSRLQIAFSTKATSEFFSSANARYYNLGFGYDASSALTEQLLQKYNIRPKAYIINADPFFKDGLSDIGRELEPMSFGTMATYAFKYIFVKNQRSICSIPLLCNYSERSIYRSPENGDWIWRGYLFPVGARGLPITNDKLHEIKDEQLARSIDLAQHFILNSGVPTSCIIITGIPTPFINSAAIAQAISASTHLPLVESSVSDLRSSDKSHLDEESADRWSAQFFLEAGQQLRDCLARA